jgi:hypothetical protein
VTSYSHLYSDRAAVLLPLAYILHLAEEWFLGLSEWTQTVLGYDISVERFILINAIALPVFAVGTLAAMYKPRMAWFTTSFAALLGINGLLHVFGSLTFGDFMPGTITGVLLYIPLSICVLRSTRRSLSAATYFRAIWIGVAAHAVVALAAFA